MIKLNVKLTLFLLIMALLSNQLTMGASVKDDIIDEENRIHPMFPTPPTVSDIQHSPENPDNLLEVNVSAYIFDSDGLTSTTLHYRALGESVFNSTGLSQIGSTNYYSTKIGPYQAGLTVEYYINAIDTFGANRTETNSGQYYNFTVIIADYDNPVISNIEYGRVSVNDNATISCQIDDMTYTTGILSYTLNFANWYNKTMDKNGNVYTVTLDKYSYQTRISFKIIAIDSAFETHYSIEDNGGSYYNISIEISDTTAPVIEFVEINPVVPNEGVNVTIYCWIYDAFYNIEEAKIYYRVNVGEWVEKDLTKSEGDGYIIDIGFFNANDLVEFYITAKDNSTNYNEAINDNNGSYYSFTVLKNTTSVNLYIISTIFALATINVLFVKRRKQ